MREKLRNFANYTTNQTSDVLIERFIKEAKDLCRDKTSGKVFGLPHSLDFYNDICILAFQLITRGPKKDTNYFTKLLLEEYVHFLEEVLNIYEERNKGKGKYIGKVNFDSKVLDSQREINYTGPPGQKPRELSLASPAETSKQVFQKKEGAAETTQRKAQFVPK